MAINSQSIGTPSVTNDSSQGYSAGSFWRDVVTGKVYVCTDATVGAAVWGQVSVDASKRTLPVDADAAIVRSPVETGLLQELLREIKTIRMILGTAFNLPFTPEEME